MCLHLFVTMVKMTGPIVLVMLFVWRWLINNMSGRTDILASLLVK